MQAIKQLGRYLGPYKFFYIDCTAADGARGNDGFTSAHNYAAYD